MNGRLWRSKQPGTDGETAMQPTSSGGMKCGLDLLAETVRVTESQNELWTGHSHNMGIAASKYTFVESSLTNGDRGINFQLSSHARANDRNHVEIFGSNNSYNNAEVALNRGSASTESDCSEGVKLRHNHIRPQKSCSAEDPQIKSHTATLINKKGSKQQIELRICNESISDSAKKKRGNRASWPGVFTSPSNASKTSIKVLGYKPARGRARAKQLASMTSEEIEGERLARLERNRLCAKACRERKKGKDAECQKKLEELQEKVKDYKHTISTLQARVAALEQELIAMRGLQAVH